MSYRKDNIGGRSKWNNDLSTKRHDRGTIFDGKGKPEELGPLQVIGLCPVCFYRLNVKRDGLMRRHKYKQTKEICAGYNQVPLRIVTRYHKLTGSYGN